MVEDRKEKAQKNKGVNVKETKKTNTYFSDTESYSAPSRSMSKVKNELQTVIDLMGPDTPHFNRSTSNDADNEESVFSSISIKYSDKSEAVAAENNETDNSTDKTIPPDITLEEETDCSMIVDQRSTYLDTQNHDFSQYICPPPLLPANVMFNSECMCPQIASFLHKEAMSMPCIGETQNEIKKCERHKNFFHNWLKSFKGKQGPFSHGDYYTINMKQSRDNQSLPKRLVFDLVGDIPKREECRCKEEIKETFYMQNNANIESKDSKNFNNEQITRESQPNEMKATSGSKENFVSHDKTGREYHQKTTYSDGNGTTRVDVYYFDHGDSSYLKTTDSPPVIMSEALAEKTEAYTTKFWAEIFGTVHIGVAFCTSFILQLFRFVLYSVFRPLTVGLIQLLSDYFFKPFIATTFNAIIQPPLLFFYNVGTSLRDLCEPIAEGLGYFLREIAVIFRAIRIVEVRKDKSSDTPRRQENL